MSNTKKLTSDQTARNDKSCSDGRISSCLSDSSSNPTSSSEREISRLLSADEILMNDWPEPDWVIPRILPAGLSVLGGAAKIGKSWWALQIAQAVGAGGMIFDQRVLQGSVLFLALEDPIRRLKERMKKQKWSTGLDVDFITLEDFPDKVGDLRKGGYEKLSNLIESQKYRLVEIDTFSRAISGDQSDVAIVTEGLSPIQRMAHTYNCAVVLLDHHSKGRKDHIDPIADLLGSTAKGAMADTVLGLYTLRGKAGAKFSVTGREVEYQIMDLKMDWLTGCWQLENGKNELTLQRNDLLQVLKRMGPSSLMEIVEVVGRNKGNIYKQLVELEKDGYVQESDGSWVSMS